MAITVTNLGASQPGSIAAPDYENNADQTSYANASWTPPTSGLILLWVYNTKATTLGSAGTASGNNITWTQIATDGMDAGSQTHRLTLYAANASGATTGQTTVSYGAVTQSSIIMQFQKVLGADLSGGVSAAFVQKPTNTGSSATSLTVTLAAAANTANRFFCGIGHGTSEDHTPENGWTELDDFGGTSPGHGLMVMWHQSLVSDTTPTISWSTSSGTAGIACEIKELASNETNTITTTEAISDTVSKAVTYIKSLSTTEAISDSISKLIIFGKTITTTEGLTDSISKSVSFAKTLSDIIGLTDLVTAIKESGSQSWTYLVTNTVGITDTISRAVNYIRSLSDTVGLTDLVNKSIGFGKTLSDTLGLSDSINAVLVFIPDALHKLHILGSRLTSSIRGRKSTHSLIGNKSSKSTEGNISTKSIEGNKSSKSISGEIDN